MKRSLSSAMGALFAMLLGALLLTPRAAFAQDHVVSPAQIQKDVAGASATRQQHVEQIDGFLSAKEVQQAMKSAHINEQEVKTAVRELDDEDLARISARAEQAKKDFAAGTFSDRDLLILVVLFVALILIIVAVR